MFKYFSFKKKQKEKEKENTTIPLILNKLDRIIELLEQQEKERDNRDQEYPGTNYHFEQVQIDHLENIIFRLDNIEINELSGRLIIGNNINSTEEMAKPLIEKMNKENAKKEAMSDTASSDQPKIQKTAKGYRFRNEF